MPESFIDIPRPLRYNIITGNERPVNQKHQKLKECLKMIKAEEARKMTYAKTELRNWCENTLATEIEAYALEEVTSYWIEPAEIPESKLPLLAKYEVIAEYMQGFGYKVDTRAGVKSRSCFFTLELAY
jgi:hypothetical protein